MLYQELVEKATTLLKQGKSVSEVSLLIQDLISD